MQATFETSPKTANLPAWPRSAIILVAGRGRRLGSLPVPKCMLEVGGQSLLEHQVRALSSVGVRLFELVIGYASEQVMSHARTLATRYGVEFGFTYNPGFDTSNTLVSMALASQRLRAGAWCLNGDVLFPVSVVQQLRGASDEAILAIDPHACAQEEVKVIVDAEHRITAISKQLDPEHSLGESVGVACFRGSAAIAFAEALEAISGAVEHRDAYYEFALQEIASRVLLRAVEVEGPVIEIDFPEDLRQAREVVYPQIADAGAA